MVQARVAGNLEERVDRARLRVGAPVDQTSDAGVDQRAGAHRTRLQRDVERAVEQAPPAHLARAVYPRPTMRPARATTAPTGTSPRRAASAPSSRHAPMKTSSAFTSPRRAKSGKLRTRQDSNLRPSVP